MASRNIYGAVNRITFEAFILRELVPKLWKGACVVMDNAKINCGEMVKKFIEEAGAKLIYLSPYSPEFSPIENFWSQVKSILRKLKTRNYLDLIDAIADAIAVLKRGEVCPMPTEAYALCPRRPMPYARRVPHVTEKGYMLQVTKKDIHNWFAHCCYCTS